MDIKHFILSFGLLFLLACGSNSDSNINDSSEKKESKDTLDKIGYLKKEVQDEKVLDFSKEGLTQFLYQDLKIESNEVPTLKFDKKNIIGDSNEETIVIAQLRNRAENKFGKFDPKNDIRYGLIGPYHYVYVFKPSDSTFKKITINGSAVIPISVNFPEIGPNKTGLNIDYRIRETSFKFLYGETKNGLDLIFSTTNYNLKKYADNPLMVNKTIFDLKNEQKGFYGIEIKDAEITNYDKKEVESNLYSFVPEIKMKEGVKRRFFMDTLTWKYATYVPR